MTDASELERQLKEKQICRFCLAQNDSLTNIHSRQNRLNNSAPLPLQVMACVSIEVFSNDGMPSFVCGECRLIFEHAYRFKQMCKKADTSLRQFPLTGKWPAPLFKPKIPEELFPKQTPIKVLNKPTESKFEEPNETITIDTSVQKFTIQTLPSSTKFKVVSTSPKVTPPKAVTAPKIAQPKPRVLNKSTMKILNKEANSNFEPVLSRPIIKTDLDGNVELVTEILDANTVRRTEPDPVESAVPIETNVFPCSHCERSFPLKQLLDIHMVNHRRERSYECSYCDKRFFSKYDLNKHLLIHTGEKPYKCIVCPKAFTRSTLLSRHEKIHTDTPKFLCVYCEKEFLSKEEMEKHAARHTKSRPFSCKICNKAFAFKQGLERHELIHSKVQPFPCQYCDLSFSTSSKLSRHLTAHAGERPYPCKLCPKSYLLSHHLTRHLRSHKEGSGSYNCCECKKVFSSRDDLIYHSAVHATQNLICPLCKEAFNDLDTVTKHIEAHADGEQYACEFCDLIYMTSEKLHEHSNLEHSEDMAVYEDHLEQPASIPKSEYGDIENEQIIEEFIIEQYHGDNQDITEEETWETESIAKMQPRKRSFPTLNENSSSVTYNKIEAMDPIDESSLLSELIDDPTPVKMIKTENDENSQLRVVSKSNKPTVQKDKTLLELENRKPSGRLIQSNLTNMIKTLPKTVTITRKSDSKTPEEKIIPREKRQRIEKNDDNVKQIENKTKATPVTRASSIKSLRSAVDKKPDLNALKIEKPQKITAKSVTISESSSPPSAIGNKQLVEMTIGNRRVKVHKITVSKAQAAAMSKEGRIELKDGTMILKQTDSAGNGKKKIIQKIST